MRYGLLVYWSYVLSLLVGVLWGQHYFGDTTAVWRVAEWGSYCYGKPTYPGVYEYYFCGDTLLGGERYWKVCRRTIQLGTLPVYAPEVLNGYIGGLRKRYDPSYGDTLFYFYPLDRYVCTQDPDNAPPYYFSDLLGFLFPELPGKLPEHSFFPSFFQDTSLLSGYSCLGWEINCCSYCKIDTIKIFGEGRVRKGTPISLGFYELGSDIIWMGWWIEGIGWLGGPFSATFFGEYYPGIFWKVGLNAPFSPIIWTPIMDWLTPRSNVHSRLLCYCEGGQCHEFVPNGCRVDTPRVNGGPYVPYLGRGAKWRIGVRRSGYVPAIYEYRIGGDTLIGGRLCRKVYRVEVKSGAPPTFASSVLNGYIGSLYEDTLGRRVWFVPRGSQVFWILYDFSVIESGYPMWSYFLSLCGGGGETYCPPLIVGVDTIRFFGRDRLRWKVVIALSDSTYLAYFNEPCNTPDCEREFRFRWDTVEVIEGIGVLESPFDFHIPEQYMIEVFDNGADPQYLEYYKDTVLCGGHVEFELLCLEWGHYKYVRDTFGCSLVVGGLGDEEFWGLRVRRLEGRLRIEGFRGEVEVYDVLGRVMELPVWDYGEGVELEVGDLVPGVYLVCLRSCGGVKWLKFQR